MTHMTAAGRGSNRTGSEQVLVGAFGWPETPRKVAACPQDGCDRAQILATDLYCTSHDRFLVFVRAWTGAGRVTAGVIGAALVYGCFALAAQLNSFIPIFIIYAVIGLGVIGLPLRLFPFTIRTAVFVWFVAYSFALTYHYTGSHSHAIMVTALILVAACALGLHSGVLSVQKVLTTGAIKNDDHRPTAVLAAVTGTLVISAAAAVIALSLLLVPSGLLVGESRLMHAAIVTAIAAVALSLLIAVVGGLVDGAPRVSLVTPGIPVWQGPGLVTWRAQRTAIRHRRIRTIVDRMGEVLRHSLIRLADALHISSVATARIAYNLLLMAIHHLANGLIRCANLIFKLIVILLRGILSGLASAWWFGSRATGTIITSLLYAGFAAGLPIIAIFITAGLTIVSAEQTRSYLIYGSLISLLRFCAVAVLEVLVLTVAWIILASQPVRDSLRSVRRSASITAPYALILTAAGGWIVGLPGTFGPGRIHVGWVTLVSTSALVIALIFTQFTNKTHEESEGDAGIPRGGTARSPRSARRDGARRRAQG